MKKNSMYVIVIFLVSLKLVAAPSNICLLPVDSCSPAPCSYRIMSTGIRIEPLITSLPLSLMPPQDTCLGPVLNTTIINFKTLPLVEAPMRELASQGGGSSTHEQSQFKPVVDPDSGVLIYPATTSTMNSYVPSWVVAVSDIKNIPSAVTYTYNQWHEVNNTGAADVNCDGKWSACNASNKRTYSITQPKVGAGAACPYADGFVDDCSDCKVERWNAGVITEYVAGDVVFENFKTHYANSDKKWDPGLMENAVRMRSGTETSEWGFLIVGPNKGRPANVGACNFTQPPPPAVCTLEKNSDSPFTVPAGTPIYDNFVLNYGNPGYTWTHTSGPGAYRLKSGTDVTSWGRLVPNGAVDFWRPKPVAATCADFPLPYVGVTAKCGSADDSVTGVAPTANLCDVGNPSAVMGSGPWSWTCTDSTPSAVACESN